MKGAISMTKEKWNFTKAAARFFYRKGVDNLTCFTQELKALTIEDKKELAPLLAQALDLEEVIVA